MVAIVTKAFDPGFSFEGGLITFTIDGENCCLGYLMDFGDRGVYCAHYGRVNVTPTQAEEHNRVFDRALIHGLDNQCEIGQGNVFYVRQNDSSVRSFIGTRIGTLRGARSNFEFERDGRVFRGKPERDSDAVFFVRIK